MIFNVFVTDYLFWKPGGVSLPNMSISPASTMTPPAGISKVMTLLSCTIGWALAEVEGRQVCPMLGATGRGI